MSEINWTVVLNDGTVIKITNLSIDRSTKKVNRATFNSPSFIPTSDGVTANLVRIYCSTYPKPVFDYAKVIKCADQGKSIFAVTVEEISSFLYNVPLTDGDNHNLVIKSKDKFNNKKTIKRLIVDLIDNHVDNDNIILTSVNFHDMSGVGNLTTIPLLDKVPIPDMEFGNMMVVSAIRKMMTDTLGLDMWFTATAYAGGSKYIISVNYGLSNGWSCLDLTQPWTTCSKIESTELTPVQKVYVISSDGKMMGLATSSTSTSSPLVAKYKIDGTYTQDDLNAFASSILNDRQDTHESFTLHWPAGQALSYIEGTLFTGIGDKTNSDEQLYMEWKGHSNPYITTPLNYSAFKSGNAIYWKITDIHITDQYTDITIGKNKLSIFDIYKNQLSEITDGLPIPTENKVVESS